MPLHITPEQLRLVVPNLTTDRATTITSLILQICPSYGIDTNDILHEFLAQCAHESGGFRVKSENMNYSWQRLRSVFKKYFRTDIEARRYDRQPQKIANYVYGGRMGNKNPGDGWFFRGAGFIQMTGREMFTAYAIRNKMTAEQAAEKVRNDDWWAMDSACWIYAMVKGLVPLSRINTKEAFITITKRINGGTNGYIDRVVFLDRARKYIPLAA